MMSAGVGLDGSKAFFPAKTENPKISQMLHRSCPLTIASELHHSAASATYREILLAIKQGFLGIGGEMSSMSEL